MTRARSRSVGLALAMMCSITALSTACSTASASGSSKTMTLYTSTSANVEQAEVAAFEKAHPGTKITVFRAATGPLNARIAADVRSGGIQADAIWASDPLTMHGYDEQKLLARWSPSDAAQIPSAYRTADFAGVDLLYMVVVVHAGTTPPASYTDLTGSAYSHGVVLPSPSFAASALGMLGYFAAAPGYGIGYYQQLKSAGAKQLQSPSDTLTAVEQGTSKAGFTLANAAYADQQKGSPIEVVWPKPGGIAIYSPIGITTKKSRSPLAKEFADFVASSAGQQILAAQDTYPVMSGIASGPPIPAGSAIISPQWPSLFANSKSVLSSYTAIFGS
jgi:iron(III) transport system substrate-binding protein